MSLAVDSHAHIFVAGLALAAERRYQPDYEAPLAAYLAMLDKLGLSHGALIQPSFLGTDNGFLVAALAKAGGRLKGVAVLAPDCPPARMRALSQAGIVGIRLNLEGRPDPPLADPLWKAHLATAAGLGWHVELQARASRLPDLLPPLLEHGAPLVVDHFGLAETIDEPGFRYLLKAAGSGQVWVKLSAGYRSAPLGWRAAPVLLEAFGPQRLLWGSDWPHTRFEATVATPDQLAALDRWVPDADARRQILWQSPSRLFGFS